MKRIFYRVAFASLAFALCGVCADAAHARQRKPAAAQAGKTKPKAPAAGKAAAAVKPKAAASPATAGATDDDAAKAQLDEIVKQVAAPAERIERLEAFMKANPKSASRPRAEELLTSARAALGDERLRTGDRLAGVELFRAAVAGAPEAMSDKLFVEVLSQLPGNLYVHGEREAALELARAVAARAKTSAPRLLTVAAFYLSVERPDEAARLAAEAVRLQPDLAPAHLALAASYRFGLRLEEAAAEFKRALELDPRSSAARRSLADLLRATGKADEAVALYREQLQADPRDAGARAGLALSLFDAGKREEAERELEGALMEQAGNLPLLVGASYWYAAQGEGARSLELADRAVALEPRYRWVWAHLARARALLALKRPLEAERAVRQAHQLGSFPTLDYELANALAAAGFYEEAAEQLSRSFALRDGQIETRLAGHVEARAADFGELLAPERRAGLFQFRGAGTEAEARRMKALLAFRAATSPGAVDEKAAAEAAREFAAGDDAMRTYRDMYVAERLLRANAGHAAVIERAESAVSGVEAALDVPVAPLALFADTVEVRSLRERTIESGEPLNVLAVQRDVLSKVLRGRIEDLVGWALYGQGRTAEAVVRLRRAVSVLPEGSEWWRTSVWRLGAALEASGSNRDALSAYVSSYRALPDPTRRAAIEALYRKLNNGSLSGLEKLLEPPAVASTTGPRRTPATAEQPADTTPAPAATPDTTPTTGTPAETAAPTLTPAETPAATPTPTPAETPAETPTPTPAETPAATPAETPSPTPTPAPTPAATPDSTTPVAPQPRPSRRAQAGDCVLSISEPSLTIKSNGGSAPVTVTFENYTGASTPRVESSTDNWADIVVLAAPRTERTAARFTVNSVSAKTGAFVVTFTTPCGKLNLTVNVQGP